MLASWSGRKDKLTLFHSMLSVLSAVLLFPLPQPGSNRPPGQPPEFKGFPILPPIATADPSIRTEREFRLPAELQVKRTADQMSLTLDDMRPVKVKVGKDMVTGLKQELRVYREGKLVQSGYSSLESSPAAHPGIDLVLNRRIDKIPQAREKYTVEVVLTLFETDIPAQHLWMPESGKYRVLWTKTLKQKAE
jgi:hypothetical protein